VELAPRSDPDLVARTVASVLRVREAPGRALAETLSAHLEAKELLLVLDNCEHLIDACASLADTLLRSCAGLKILATSRERLGVAGERDCLVPSLSSPDAEPLPPLEELGRHGAVGLFVERAKAVNSAFELSEKNAPWVARLCRRLEGIPLAVEFAAARAKVLSAEQILRRLEDPLKLLSADGRQIPVTGRWIVKMPGPKGTRNWG
jgi:predicted ATPase